MDVVVVLAERWGGWRREGGEVVGQLTGVLGANKSPLEKRESSAHRQIPYISMVSRVLRLFCMPSGAHGRIRLGDQLAC